MKLKKIELTEDGKVESVWLLSTDQYYFLIHYAINNLIQRGLVQAETISEMDFKKLQEEEMEDLKKNFLKEVDVKDLPRA